MTQNYYEKYMTVKEELKLIEAHEVSLKDLRILVLKKLNVIRMDTITAHIKNLELLGVIAPSGNGVWRVL